MRFPGFDKPWVAKKLVQITSKIGSGKTPKGGEDVYMREGIPFIRSQNVINDSLILDSTHIPQKVHVSMSGSKVLPNDILLNITGGSIGRSCVVPINFIEGNVNQHVSIIRLKDDNPNFLQPILSSSRGQKLVSQAMTGSGREGLNFESIKNFKIYFPFIEEQNKVASFLQVIDKRIQSQSKIIEGLKSLKNSLSKKIFLRELRFKDENGKDYPEWKEMTLGKCLSYEQPTNYLVSSTEYQDKFETPVVTAGKTFILGYTNEVKGIFNENLPVIIFDDFTTSTQFINFPFKAKSSAMKILKAKGDINIRFIYEAMQMINYEIGGHGRHWISVFERMGILIPSIPEQNQIADFLSGIDEKIEIETSLLQQLKLQKQYFLKQLFI